MTYNKRAVVQVTEQKRAPAKPRAKRETPGSGDANDTSGKASTDQDNGRKDSGQKGRAEDKQRASQAREGLEKAAKNAAETGAPAPVIVTPPQDRPVVHGDEHRDETHDPDFDPGDGTLVQHEAFVFDEDAKTERVEHIAVASVPRGLVVEINGRYYDFDTQLSAALRRLVQAGVINLNL